MREILFYYEQVAPTTWVYLSSLLTIGLFFKFNRFWSVRNLDLLLLILLAPGLLLVQFGRQLQETALDAQAQAAAIDLADFVERMFAQQGPGEDDSDSGINGDSAPALAIDDGSPTLIPALDPDSPEAQAFGKGRRFERVGFIWLLIAGGLLLTRLIADTTMVRRPLLEPNLSIGGMIFIGVFLYLFLMANVLISRPSAEDLQGPIEAARLMSGQETNVDGLERNGPGYAMLFMLPSIPTVPLDTNVDRKLLTDPRQLTMEWHVDPRFLASLRAEYNDEAETAAVVDATPADPAAEALRIEAKYHGLDSEGRVILKLLDGNELPVPREMLSAEDLQWVLFFQACTTVAKSIAIFAHLAIIVGVVAIGYWHFENIKLGIAAALLYLMVPYTSQMTGRVDHALPAALLVWAILAYRRPLTAGIFLGLATGVIYYPFFLLPLWVSFYWQRGLTRFLIGVVSVLTIMVLVLALTAQDLTEFWLRVQKMFGLMAPQAVGLRGIWGLGWPPVYRVSVLAAFVALCGSFAIWPAQKNLGTLLSCSAAVMVATQFWHGYGGGLYVAWYLPLLLLTVFRPNLEDRVALAVLGDGWHTRRRRLAA